MLREEEKRRGERKETTHSFLFVVTMEIHSTVADPNGVVHRWVFDFELAFFDRNKYQTVEQWMEQWWWLSIPYAFIYIVAIFIGQTWMKSTNRKYELRFWLVLWNTILAVFSLWGAWRAVPELFYSIDRYGFTYSICDPSYKKGITGLWYVVKEIDEFHVKR